MEYGYARVSTREQNEARQMIALTGFGIAETAIFVDRQSGKDFERTQYRRLMRKLKDGDTLVVKSIDRLWRNYEEILEQWRVITKEKRAAIVVLDMPLLDTRQNRDFAASFLCCADGARIHPAAAGRGHCGGKGARRSVWSTVISKTGGIPGMERAVEQRRSLCLSSGQGIKNHPPDLPSVGKGQCGYISNAY